MKGQTSVNYVIFLSRVSLCHELEKKVIVQLYLSNCNDTFILRTTHTI